MENGRKKVSERHGYTPVREQLQFECMDEACKNIIWNCIQLLFWRDDIIDDLNNSLHVMKLLPSESRFMELIWFQFLKKPIHSMPNRLKKAYNALWEVYNSFIWYEVFDFLEFISCQYGLFNVNPGFNIFKKRINGVLKREGSAYRFVDGHITPITSEAEIEAIESNIEDEAYPGVQAHIKSALELLSRREEPDFRNSMKESISAIESICQVISSDKDAPLGQILKQLNLHPALKNGFGNLYGYTSNEEGIRHALFENETELNLEDALYFLVSCSAFINYLKAKFPKQA